MELDRFEAKACTRHGMDSLLFWKFLSVLHTIASSQRILVQWVRGFRLCTRDSDLGKIVVPTFLVRDLDAPYVNRGENGKMVLCIHCHCLRPILCDQFFAI